MKTRYHSIVSLGTALLAASCSSDRSPNSHSLATSRDSAGVTIIENDSVATPARYFGTAPILVIGSGDGDPKAEFFRIAGALALRDGRIVVADGASGELRFFGRDGIFSSSSGGRGGGPGEFENLEFATRLAGDTILTYDGGRREVSLFDPAGALLRTVSLGSVTGSRLEFGGLLQDGSMVLVQYGTIFGGSPDENEAGQIVQDTATIFRRDPAGERVDTIATLACGSGSVERLTFPSMGISQLFMAPVHCAATPLVYTLGNRIMAGSCSEYSLYFHRANGSLEQIARKAQSPVSVSDNDVATLLQAYRDLVGEDGNPFAEITLEVLEDVPAVEFLPPFAGLPARPVVDSDGNMWIPTYSAMPSVFVFGDVQPVETPSWDVFDADGRMLGVVQSPRGFRLTDLGDGIAVGVRVGADDVETVVVYELTRNAAR